MTLRLTDAQSEALRRRAEREGRSMQQVALSAVDDYLARTEDDELTERLAERPRRCRGRGRPGRRHRDRLPACRLGSVTVACGSTGRRRP